MSNQALIIIDLQNDYFPGGKWELHDIEKAAQNAVQILEDAREKNIPVFHVHHEFLLENPPFFAPNSDGAAIHESLKPRDGEATILKHQVNSFRDTNLKGLLDEKGIEDVTIIGAMSHMCIDAATRAAADFGYQVTVVEDACASRGLEFEGKTVKAEDVHAAYMSALGFAYANVISTQTYLG